MGIQSTRYITRQDAIDRIVCVASLIIIKDYLELEGITFEEGNDYYTLSEFVENWEPINLIEVYKWTDEMLEDYMDNPFFRHSMFNNYFVREENEI